MSDTLVTSRLRLRRLTAADADDLADVLCDANAMRWYPRPYSRSEVDDWIARNVARYEADGFGLWAIEWRADGRLVGDCGLVMQPLEGERVVEVGFHVRPAWQRRGIAYEAAQVCRDHARDTLRLKRLHAFVRPENEPSRRIAANLGMHVDRTLVRGAGDFVHEIWVVDFPG